MRGMWEYFTFKRAWAKKVLADAAKEKQEGIQGQWQQEPPFKEVREQVKWYSDTNCDAYMVRRAYHAEKSGNWEGFEEEFRNKSKFSEWTFVRLKEAYKKVASEDVGRQGIAWDILRKSSDILRRIIAPVVTLSYVCPHCNYFTLEDYILWVSSGHGGGNNRKKKQCSLWRAAWGQHDWRAPNRILLIQLGANANEAKVFKAHAAAGGV